MSAPLVELRGVTRRFGPVTALDGVDLEVHPGEILVVLGPTGAGKTTLLRTIAGLERPDAGAVRLGGTDVAGVPPAARDVALVFQNFSLYPDRSVRENLEFPLRAPPRAGTVALSAAEVRERVERAAETLSIARLLDRPARGLSGGEMQRVAIGRAIVRKPRLFLMDEPLSNLDAKLREALRVELAVLVRSLGTPMVYVTHDQGEALSMADRIAVLIGGRVRQTGAPREVYDRPASPLVATQLGSPRINLFEARVVGGACRAADGTRLCAAPAPSTGLGDSVLVGIRPEHLRIASPIGAAGSPSLGADDSSPAVVDLVELSGPEQVLVARWAGRRVHVLTGRSRAFTVGETVQLRADEERVVVWPGAGARSS